VVTSGEQQQLGASDGRGRDQAGGRTGSGRRRDNRSPRSPHPRPRACVTLRVTHRVGSGGDALHAFLGLECTRLLCQPAYAAVALASVSVGSFRVRGERRPCVSLSGSSRRSSSIYCSLRRVAVPCLALPCSCSFQPFFIFSTTHQRATGSGSVSVSCPVCVLDCLSLQVQDRGCGKWPRRFSFSFCSPRPNGSRRIGSKSKRPPFSCGWRYDFPCSHPTGTTDRRRTSARVVTVPFRSCTITRSGLHFQAVLGGLKTTARPVDPPAPHGGTAHPHVCNSFGRLVYRWITSVCCVVWSLNWSRPLLFPERPEARETGKNTAPRPGRDGRRESGRHGMDGRKPGALGDGLVVTVTDQPVTSQHLQRVRILWTAPADSSPWPCLPPSRHNIFFGICAFSLWLRRLWGELADQTSRVDVTCRPRGSRRRRRRRRAGACREKAGHAPARRRRSASHGSRSPRARGCLLLAVLGRRRSRRN
jgi:hypothetical protein